jgi:hypothetical protein
MIIEPTTSKEELDKLTKEELIEKVIKLEETNQSLRNYLVQAKYQFYSLTGDIKRLLDNYGANKVSFVTTNTTGK